MMRVCLTDFPLDQALKLAVLDSESGRFPQKGGDLRARVRAMSNQHVTAARITDKAGIGNVLAGVTRALEGAVEVILRADRERRGGDLLQLVTRQRRNDGCVVEQPEATRAYGQNVLHDLLDARLFVRRCARDEFWGCTEYPADERVVRQLAHRPEQEIRAQRSIEQ